jgi:hypothetical protein
MAEALAKTPVPREPKRHRVSNAEGALVGGVPGQRTLLLIHRPSWRSLEEVPDLWVSVDRRAPKLILGIVELHTEDGLYVATTATASPGYGSMLKAMSSGVAYTDGVPYVDYVGTRMRTREWGPLAGLRRRGQQCLRAIQRKHRLREESGPQLIERLRQVFLARRTGPFDGV